MRTLKAFFVSFLVSLLSFNAIGNRYYVSVDGSGEGTGVDWLNSMSGQSFADQLINAKSGDVFYLTEGIYYPKDGTQGFLIPGIDSLVGGFPKEMAVDASVKFDEASWSEDHATILRGDISIKESDNSPVEIRLGEDEHFVSVRVSSESSSSEGAFIASVSSGSTSEIVLCKGVFGKCQPSPMETLVLRDTVSVTVGDKIKVGNTEVIYFGTIGDTIISEDSEMIDGVMTTKIHHVQVFPKYEVDAQNKLHYYVKVKATGTGDGSSWENAMSDSSFAYVFDKVDDHVTFHFAAGTYRPIYYNYGNIGGSRMLSFWTDRCVSLVGGYSANPSQGDTPHPERSDCKTLFLGDYCALVFEPLKTDTISVSGIEFHSQNKMVRGGYNGSPFIVNGGDNVVALSVDKCEFDSSLYAMYLTNVDMYICNCHFHHMNMPDYGRVMVVHGNSVLSVYSSLFEHNTSILMGDDNVALNFTNCTFWNNTSFGGSEVNLSGSLSLIHNTFFDELNINGGESTEALVVGNICVGGMEVSEGSKVTSSHNLYSTENSTSWTPDHDLFAPIAVVKNIFSYKDDVPDFADNGGFIKTVELLYDTLSDGSSIRFNRKGVSNVDVDQRGIARPDSTCMGAYEIGLNKVIIPLSDTTVIAGTYKDLLHGGNSVDLGVGLVVWRDTINHAEEGVTDSIFTRTITVLPKATVKEDGKSHYYVKVDGKSDGSSWANAMSNEAFAFSIDKVADGSVFHFAAGTYNPVYENYQLVGNDFVCYWTDKCITLMGGYTANPSEDELPNPGKPETNVHFEGANFALVCQPATDGEITLYGIEFSVSDPDQIDMWGDAVVVNGGTHNVHVSIDNCSFHSSLDGLSLTNVSSDIRNSNFYENDYTDNGAIYFYGKQLNIESSLFRNNSFVVQGKGNVSVSNCTFIGNLFGLDNGDSLSFVNNTVLDGLTFFGHKMVVDIIGNLCVGELDANEAGEIKSAYNIFPDDMSGMWYSSTDILAPKEKIQALLVYEEGKPVLANNGGYTQCVALLSDTLSGGSSIRFVRTGVTNVDVDQRGVVRPDSTCAGAYEFGFTSITVSLADTVAFAGAYTDLIHGSKTVDLKIGNVAWIDTVYRTNPNAYDTIFTRNITVLPNGKKDADGKYHYYVKETGSGDGSSWDAAMGPWSFAFSFDKVQDGATFHIAEGNYYSSCWYDGPRVYRSDKVVNLIGGYAASSSNEVVLRNISKYPTKLTGDYKRLPKIVELELPAKGNAHICGINFAEAGEDTANVNFAAVMVSSKGATISLDSCSFDRTKQAVFINGCSGTISNCSFTGTKLDGETAGESILEDDGIKFDNRSGGELSILSSSFVNERTSIDGFGSLDLKNSTIANGGDDAIISHIYANGGAKYVMENNTILTGGVTLFDGYEYQLVGNIFGSLLTYTCENVNSSDNAFLEGMSACMAKSSDIQLSEEQFASLFNGGTTPILTQAKNGTYYAELLTDELSGGVSIRFDLSKTSVQTDQRGAKRHSLCCAGAYELGCPNVSQLYDDLVVRVGQQLKDEEKHIDTSFAAIGRYEWTKTISSEKDAGCTSDYSYVVSVLPNPMKDDNGKLHYYVKVDGKGDGSSWENAMGSAAFAFAFDKVEDGSTFHIAEGVYNPIYEAPDYSNSDNRSAKSFYTNKLVNIIGGYSKDERDMNALPDTSHHTILEGAQDQMSNGVHTSLYVLLYCPKEEGHFSVEYVDIRRSTRYRDIYGTVCIEPKDSVRVDFSFEHCNFNNCEGGILSRGCGGTIKYCQFEGAEGSYSLKMFGKPEDSLIIESSYIGRGCSIADYNYRITNSTIRGFVEENGTNLTTGTIENSTLVKFEAGAGRNHVLRGNIFYGTITLKGNAAQMASSSYNIYPADAEESILFKESTDLFLDADDYFYVLDHDSTNLVSADNGGFTKTIALKSDVSLDGKSLRYNSKGVTGALVDQRGVRRPESTCRGAYEFGCKPDTILVDTIINYVEGRIPGRFIDTVTTAGMGGCDDVRIISYMMLPPALTECYVTVDGAKSKTGEDWDNAMSAELFAYSLRFVEGTKKYYIAEGMYVPLFDSAGVVPEDLSKRVFYTKRSVSLVGGFTNRAKNGYEQNLKENFTCLGDTLKKNLDNIFMVNLSSSADTIFLNGIEFSSANKNVQSQGDGEGAAVKIMSQNDNLVVRAEYCTFTQSFDGLFVGSGTSIIKNVNFTDNKHAGISFKRSYKGNVTIESSSFLRNGRGLYGVSLSGKYSVRNSTFYNKGLSFDLSGVKSDSGQLLMEYNTVWGDTLNLSTIGFTATANIFGASLKGYDLDSEGQLANNLCLRDNNNNLYFKDNNWLIDKEEFLSILDLQSTYVPNLWDDNGDLYTSLIRLNRDLTSDETLIRLPLLNNGDLDQTGTARLKMTAPGSYELALVHDTVSVGTIAHDIKFDEVGVIDTTKGGVRYIVWVYPNNSSRSYYVKVNGTGDGSSWSKALSASDFVWFFPKAKSGATFYVAEGDYSFSEVKTEDVEIPLSTDKLINIIGGYPADITDMTQSADALTYAESTIFRDFPMSFMPSTSGVMRISGITFEGNDGFLSVNALASNVSVDVENCRFLNPSKVALAIDSCSAVIRGCHFENDSVGITYAGRSKDSLCLFSSSFLDGDLGIVVKEPSQLFKVYNSTFLCEEGLAVDYQPSHKRAVCCLYNNTVVGGLRISAYGAHEWIGNIFGGKVWGESGAASEKASVTSSYNIYWDPSESQTNVLLGPTDLTATMADLRSIFGLGATGYYELTPCAVSEVLRLDNDVLVSSDKSIRFPLEDSKVTEDQCGNQRKFRTCCGAYEMMRKLSDIEIPSAFTPYTQDGKNDVFMPNYELYIYDRYGHLISHSMNGWDGTYDGELADPGVYIYVLLDSEGDNRKGTVELYKVK